MRTFFVLWIGNYFFFGPSLVNGEGCKDMTFKETFVDKALEDHVFKTEQATNDAHCETKCFIDDRCIAYSFGTSANNEKYMCELSDSDHVMHPDHLVSRPNTIYRRAENKCKCEKYQVCRVNFVDNTHRCECKAGFTGQQCETEIKPCETRPCLNGAICVNNADSFTCTCAAGFTGNLCATAISHCDSTPCGNGGSCTSKAFEYQCACPDGYMGHNCQIKYYKGSSVISWVAADTKCKALGSNLPSIHSAEENKIVKQLHVIVGNWMWIGLHDQNSDGTFVWSDGTPVDYKNWGVTQLKPYGKCVYINWEGKWFKRNCNDGNGIACLL